MVIMGGPSVWCFGPTVLAALEDQVVETALGYDLVHPSLGVRDTVALNCT
jgi:hypothetical protein